MSKNRYASPHTADDHVALAAAISQLQAEHQRLKDALLSLARATLANKEPGPDELLDAVLEFAVKVIMEKNRAWVPDPRYYREKGPEAMPEDEIAAKLAKLRSTGYPLDDVQVGLGVGFLPGEPPRMSVEMPLDADAGATARLIRVYQQFFSPKKGKHSAGPVILYLWEKHSRGTEYADLANELNEAVEIWAKRERATKAINQALVRVDDDSQLGDALLAVVDKSNLGHALSQALRAEIEAWRELRRLRVRAVKVLTPADRGEVLAGKLEQLSQDSSVARSILNEIAAAAHARDGKPYVNVLQEAVETRAKRAALAMRLRSVIKAGVEDDPVLLHPALYLYDFLTRKGRKCTPDDPPCYDYLMVEQIVRRWAERYTA